ncbi:hypothetical protein EC988_006197 [Linderina pennispora]|nr:hypothetical protein EC988_006197 [Linderina pennispora]
MLIYVLHYVNGMASWLVGALAVLAGPVCVVKNLINAVQLYESARDLARLDAAQLNRRIPSGNYGSAIDLQIATADAKQRRVTYEYTVTASEVSRNYLDEGWLATVTDNATDPLICAVADTRNTFTTSLTVNNLEKIEAGVRLEIECRVIMFQGRMLQATAVFRDAAKPGTVYAMGLHTMVYKDHVGQVPGGVSLARL